MNNRFLSLVALACATTIAAQQLQPGQIVLLRSASGKYLSASPGQSLALSSNTSGWEQWEYTATPSRAFVSFHGSTLIGWDSVRSTGPMHAAWSYSAGDMPDKMPLDITAIWPIEKWREKPGSFEYQYVMEGTAPSIGAPVVMTSRMNVGAICEEGGAVVTKRTGKHYYQLDTAKPVVMTTSIDCEWTPVAVTAVQQPRAERLMSLGNGQSPAFVSAHGTFILRGPPVEAGTMAARSPFTPRPPTAPSDSIR